MPEYKLNYFGLHRQSSRVVHKERTDEQKKELETFMIKPLGQEEVDTATQRIRELKPLGRLPVSVLFPYLGCLCKIRC